MGSFRKVVYNTYLSGGKMKQVGYKNLAIFSLLFLLFTTTVFAVETDKDIIDISKNVTSQLSLVSTTLPVIADTFYVCPGDSIYDTVFYACNLVTVPPVEIIVWSGLGSITTEVSATQDTMYGYYAYLPLVEESIPVVYLVVRETGDTVYYRHEYTVLFDNAPPIIEDQSFSSAACDLTSLRSLQIVATDSSSNSLTYSLLSGQGTIDAFSGMLTYQPDTSGVFEFMVQVENGCGADTALVIDSLHLNTPPQVFCYDSLVTLCAVEEICFDVIGFDVDSDLLEINMLEGIGNFSMTSDSTGQACFIPADVDSAVYRFIFRGSDSCSLNPQNLALIGGECCTDTSLITVVINRPPVFTDLEPQNFFACDSSEFSFDLIADDYENSVLTYNILSQNASIVNNIVTVTAIMADSFDVVIEAVDDCGHADTTIVPVIIQMNNAPVVNSAADFAMTLCEPEPVCFNATIDDVDFNVADIVVNFGTYNAELNQVCFTPDTSGVYSIIITATDSCGVADFSTTNVTVELNEAPTIDLGVDYALEICAEQEVCIDPLIIDNNLNSVNTNFSFYNTQTGQICFTPDTSGSYQIIAEAIDDCGLVSVDTLRIDVTIIERPTLELGDSLSFTMCTPEEICIDVLTNKNYSDVLYNFGQMNAETGQICFTPDTSGVYVLEAELIDSCGFKVVDTKVITVEFKSAPVIANLSDTLVYLCQPVSICLPVSISDVDNDIMSITTNRGSYADGSICFVPYDSGTYEIIVTVTDSCGNVSVDTANVQVLTDQDVAIVVPNDTSFFVCQLDTFYFPVSGIPSGAEVSVTGINTWYDAANSQVGYYAECSSNNKITLTVVTECNTFTEQFNVTIICNTDPLVILPQDTTIFMCDLAPISLPVGVTDVDNNLVDVTAIGGTYDNVLNIMTFTPDTSGIYILSISATDSCEANDYDEIAVTVVLNDAPVVVVPEDAILNLCEPTQLSLPVFALDNDSNNVVLDIVSGGGQIVDGNWVYNAVADDSITVIIRATDNCGVSDEKTFTILVHMNNAPQWTGESVFFFEQCTPTEVFIPFEAFDIDGDALTFRLPFDIGPFNDSGWVYTPTGSETVEFVAQVSDSCGAFTEKTFTVTFKINEAPYVNAGDDFSTFLCEPGEVCFDVVITDDNRAYTSIPNGFFNWTTEQYCFNADTSGVYEIEVSATDSCDVRTVDTVVVTVTINEAPVVETPADTSFIFCDTPQVISLPYTSYDADSNLDLCEIVSGPGLLVNGNWEYNALQSEDISVTIRCTDSCGVASESTFSVSIYFNQLPEILNQNFAQNYCDAGVERTLAVLATDLDDKNLTYELISGAGVIDAQTGVITYSPDTSGAYLFTVVVSDECGSATALITDVIGINNPALFNPFDSTVYLCNVEDISFDISATDPDGDRIILSQNSGLGKFTQLTDSTGQTVFTPADVDSATYTFVYCVTDSCGDYPEQFIAATCADTVRITVIIDQAPQIVCPTDLKFFTCEIDTFTFNIDANDPEFGQLTYNILSGNATLNNQTVSVVGTQADSFDVVIEVVDECGHADTCTVPVVIDSNRPPYITSADDFSLDMCDVEQVCFAVTADDLDFNLSDISVNFGTFDAVNDQVCFTPDTSGVYTIITTATDSCGAVGLDTTVVTIDVNEAPIVDAGADFAVSLCSPGEVCFDVSIIDNNRAYTSIPNGFFNWTTEQYCFNADTSGVYEIEVSATDSCGLMTSDIVVVTVTISEGPFVDLGSDLDLFVCELTEYCVDISTINNFDSIIVTGDAVYNAQTSQICFSPTEAGSYFASVQVFDSCGLSAYDEINVNITSNLTPTMSMMPDTTVYLCQPTSICLPIDIQDDNMASITVNRGSYENGQVCFVPYDSGSYEIIVTAIDSCGLVVADTALVQVSTDQGIQLSGQVDTTIFVCELDTMCFPVYGIPAGADVTVSGINTWYNAETNEVCYFAECSSANKIKVTATTECGSYDYSFTVTVVCNTAPLVILPQDTSLTICSPQDISLPLGITDVDNNLGAVTVSSGSYDPVLSLLTFRADTAGTYIVGVTANDTCGASDYDEIVVTIKMNSAPTISYTAIDTTMSCSGAEICLPIDIGDIDNNLLSVTTTFGTYSNENNQICFVPDTSGYYCIEVTATDECGLITVDTACVIVEVGGFVQLECPTVIVADSICGADSVSVPLVISGEVLSVVSSLGQFSNGQLSFFADTAGLYTVSVTATADCNEVTCEFTIEVNNKIDVELVCSGDLDTLLCGVDTLYFDYTTSSAVESIIVSSPAYISNNQVVVPIATAGSYTIEMVASGACGIDTCSFTVNALFNSAPTITSIDTTLTVCAIDTICIPFEAFDIDTNLVDVSSSVGVVSGNTICVLPIAYGQTSVVLTATDACGATGTYVTNINLTQGATAAIICPQDQFVDLCGPDSVCIVLPITPFDATITILNNGVPATNANFDPESGSLCLFVEEAGVQSITIIADAMCGTDTCNFDITSSMSQLPTVSSPVSIDSTICLAQNSDICFDVQTSGTGVQVSVSNGGTFSAGVVCVPLDAGGTFEIEIIASNDCGADTTFTTLNIAENIAPILNLPATQTFTWCPDDTNTICIDGIFAQDAVQIIALDLVCGVGEFNKVFSDTGVVCFIPDSVGLYSFCVEASDGCQTVTDTFYVEVVEREDCDVCVRLSIDGGAQIPVGVQTDVILNIETNTIIGGFDVLLSFDASVMTFNTATIVGSEIEGWEYFTYRLGSEDCGANCPSGLVRLVGLADLSNGPVHPPVETLEPQGTLVSMNFLVANDQNLGDLFLPIEFAWYDCGDNTFSNTLGSILYLDTRIYGAEFNLLWDENDDIFFPESSRPFGLGAVDQCSVGASSAPIRCVEFINGGIKVIHPDSIDARGDINLNNISYEIGDAVLYSNYFIYGLGVFTINVAGQIAASDVNADGLTLSVADLVLMIRIIVGDATPIPKLVPYAEALQLESNRSSSVISVSTNSVSEIGGMLLVYDIANDISIDAVKPTDAASDMQMMYDVVDGQLRVLMYDMGRNYIESGENSVLEILFNGEGSIDLVKVEVVDYQGRPYNVNSKLSQLPQGFALSQNYPNPFNPTTTIELALPIATDWSLLVFNINGHLVHKFAGNNEAGIVSVEWDGTNESGQQVASGMYLYRIEAANFTQTKKMILLK